MGSYCVGFVTCFGNCPSFILSTDGGIIKEDTGLSSAL